MRNGALQMHETETNNFSSQENAERMNILRYKVLETQIGKIWKQSTEAGFEPILIKGWAAAQFYPRPYERQFSDVDLIIAPEHFEEAAKFFNSLPSNIPVDLHRGARHLDQVDFQNLFSNSKQLQCGATKIRVLREEDHLRILCVHWLNDGGANREKLWDIYYGVARRSKDFDWDRFLSIVSSRRRRWLICAIGLAHHFLGLDLEDTPVAREAQNLPDWLIKAVIAEWESGVRLLDLRFCLNDRKAMWEQLKKRFPPNPVQATIEMEGSFDDHPRIFYQIKSIFPRLFISVKKMIKT
jgi:hypothetical protein